MTIVSAILALGGLTLLLGLILVIANQKLYVYEDPRIDHVEDLLPHANCGACGYPGCRPFAEALVKGVELPSRCTVSSAEGHKTIANYLGIEAGSVEKKVARLACGGGFNVALNRASYEGIQSCQASTLISGGGKGCFWGCLGYGDCEKVCDFDAITMDAFGLPQVNTDKCTACGDCVEICPKDLFSIQPIEHRLWVNCKNLEAGDEVLEDCQVGCTACGKCAHDATDGLISMINNIPVIDYKNAHQTMTPIQRCPTGAIIWWDDDGAIQKGKESKKVIRRGHRIDGYS